MERYLLMLSSHELSTTAQVKPFLVPHSSATTLHLQALHKLNSHMGMSCSAAVIASRFFSGLLRPGVLAASELGEGLNVVGLREEVKQFDGVQLKGMAHKKVEVAGQGGRAAGEVMDLARSQSGQEL